MKRVLIIAAGLFTAIFLSWSIYVINVNEGFNKFSQTKIDLRSEKEKQLDFLKENQDEIIEFVKELNPKIESVQIDWKQTKWEEVGNGTPWGAGEVISVYGQFNHLEKSSWNVLIGIKDGRVDMEDTGLSNGLRLGGGYFE